MGMKRPPKRSGTMGRSQAQERKTARDMGGRTVPGSGSKWSAKGDVKTRKYLIECKTTEAASYPLTKAVWNKIRREAIKEGKTAAMRVDIQGVELVVISRYDFLLLTDEGNGGDSAGHEEEEIPVGDDGGADDQGGDGGD